MLDTIPAPHHPGADPEQDEPGIYEIFLRDVVMLFRIGVYPSEYKAPQRVRIDLDLDVRQDRATLTDDIGDVVSYDDIMNDLRRIAAGERVPKSRRPASAIPTPTPCPDWIAKGGFPAFSAMRAPASWSMSGRASPASKRAITSFRSTRRNAASANTA